ncbi:MAG TPA: SEFIR domain-containing protein [Rhizobium sp.]|nr:SEFIR domain-containing protein [Rhizobium sp.]
MSEEAADPKLFISYSWSNQDHESWVVKLAEELVSQGIHVILDKWDLQPGHDANDFMEGMVKDKTVTKVIMVCDEVYARKSDSRKGGAGTEAQIITPEIYAETRQDKFVAVVRERDADGKPFLPTYYKGRIYFDLSDPSGYAEEFDKIVRWAWNKPLYVRPTPGQRPGFLSKDGATGKIASSVAHRRAVEAVRNGATNAIALVGEYLETITIGLENFRLKAEGSARDTFDELVVESIADFTPYRNELIDLFMAVAQHIPSEAMAEVIHRFFERCLPYYNVPESISSYSEWDFDNYRFIVHELFIYCIAAFIRFERFEAAAYFVNTEYYRYNRFREESAMHSFSIIDENLSSLEFRNRRLELRRYSLRADMLKDRNQGTGIAFHHLMAADFVLFLRSRKQEGWQTWWPETLLYAERSGGPFEMFARAKSAKYFERIKVLLGFENAEEFKVFMLDLLANRDRLPKWGFHGPNVGGLSGVANIAAVP